MFVQTVLQLLYRIPYKKGFSLLFVCGKQRRTFQKADELKMDDKGTTVTKGAERVSQTYKSNPQFVTYLYSHIVVMERYDSLLVIPNQKLRNYANNLQTEKKIVNTVCFAILMWSMLAWFAPYPFVRVFTCCCNIIANMKCRISLCLQAEKANFNICFNPII